MDLSSIDPLTEKKIFTRSNACLPNFQKFSVTGRRSQLNEVVRLLIK